MIDGEPQIGFRAYVKDQNNRVKKVSTHFDPAPSYRDKYMAKLSGALDLSKEENQVYREAVADIKKDIIEQYANAGIKLTDSMFPNLVLTRQKIDNKNEYYRRENTAIVTVGSQPSFFDLIHIHHELNHGISTRTEVIDPKNGEPTYVHTGLATINGNGVQTGRILEEGLMTQMSLEYASKSENMHLTQLRDEHFNMLVDRLVLERDDYPTTPKERFDVIKDNLSTLSNYRYAHETILSLLIAADKDSGQKGKDKLISSLLWARVLPTKKADLIKNIDDITEPGIGKKIFTTPFSADLIHFLNTEVRTAYFKRSRKH